MSDSPSKSPSPKQAKPLHRLSIGTFVVVQIALAAIILLTANYLSALYHQDRDLSRGNEFSLSPLTKKLLRSDPVKSRAQPIRMIVAVRKSSEHYNRLRAMTEAYEHKSRGAVTVEFVDPIRDGDRAFEIAEAYDHIFVDDVVIIDARSDQAPPADPAEPAEPAAERPRAAASPHIKIIPLEEMLVYRTDGPNKRSLIGYQDEDLLSSLLRSAIEGQARRFYFLADKSQLQDASENTPWSTLSNTLRRQNIALTPIRLSDYDRIPDDAEGLALVAPQYDLEERELEMLQDYWARPRAALLVVLDPVHRPDRIRSFLREYGITPRHDRLMTLRDGGTSSNVLATFTFGAQLNYTDSDLEGKATVFEGGTCSLEIREGAEDLLNRRISPIALIQTADRYWGETKFTEENATFDPHEDYGNPAPGQGAPLYLAGAVIRGNATNDQTAPLTSRMVVISNSSFLHPQRLRAEQVDFLRNSANWLIGREDLMGVGPKPIQRYKINLVPKQVSFVNRLNLFFIPGALLLAGFAVWNVRRS